MSSELPDIAANLQTFLEESCPPAWRIVNAETLGTSKTSGVVLSWEQLDISQVAEGQQLPEGWVWVTFQVVLSVPETDATKAMPKLTATAGQLLQVFDSSPDLRWGPDATRTRLTTGESAFVIPLAVLASNAPPPTPEPATEPVAPEEE